MKGNTRTLMYRLCSLCIAFSGIWYWDRVSLLFFGEPKYPDQIED